jgi:hypothetical protein
MACCSYAHILLSMPSLLVDFMIGIIVILPIVALQVWCWGDRPPPWLRAPATMNDEGLADARAAGWS